MKNKWSIIVLIIAIVILAVILIVCQVGFPSGDGVKIFLPEATGDAGDTAEAVLKMAENEADILSAESADLDLVDLELQGLEDFENIYDENEL